MSNNTITVRFKQSVAGETWHYLPYSPMAPREYELDEQVALFYVKHNLAVIVEAEPETTTAKQLVERATTKRRARRTTQEGQ